ncbi:MAG: LysR family transcriptional regulator [Sediminibacterium sp.]|uniref:LysR family transcriptional regulator n=1 Tax=Sediminibacterium sp. TaxID=1917865 RepID=UPI00271D86FE|nr:LysR family transcriptional regulator [Sediminibacterium sp.]MDO8995992.1 LysR family transcriptional regulator [Sediminibacterium sp.]
MNYTLNQLQIFLKVVETLSVTKAAEELHLSQPAVSIQLKNFQDQFEIPLTEVVGRKIYITDFGKEIAKSAENILLQVHAMNNKTSSFKGQLTGKLKIAVVSTGKYVMPYFLNEFIKTNTGIQLNIDVTNKSMVIESLEKNEVDFALVSILPAGINIEKIDLLPNKLFLIGNTQTKLSIQDLPLIFREKGSGTRQAMEQFIQKNKLSIQKKMELSTNEAVKQSIIAGLGYSIMPIIGIKNEVINKQLFIIPTKGLPIKTTWSLIWLKRKKHSPVADAYLKYLKQEKNQVAKTIFSWSDQF